MIHVQLKLPARSRVSVTVQRSVPRRTACPRGSVPAGSGSVVCVSDVDALFAKTNFSKQNKSPIILHLWTTPYEFSYLAFVKFSDQIKCHLVHSKNSDRF